jgi:hypothetical protein
MHLTGMYLIGIYGLASHWYASHRRVSPTGGTVDNFSNDLCANSPTPELALEFAPLIHSGETDYSFSYSKVRFSGKVIISEQAFIRTLNTLACANYHL